MTSGAPSQAPGHSVHSESNTLAFVPQAAQFVSPLTINIFPVRLNLKYSYDSLKPVSGLKQLKI